MNDQEQQRKTRADALRRQIAQLKRGPGVLPGIPGSPSLPGPAESPNQFVHRRMRELAQPAVPDKAKRSPKR